MSTISEKATAAKNSAKRFIRRLLWLLLVLGIGVLLFLHYATFSEGVRAGTVIKISKKGAIFKTYEGQLDLQTLGAVNDDNQLSQTFNFSVYKSDDHVYKMLEEASLSGKRVQVRYEEKYAALPWRGDTQYFVTDVTVSDGAEPQKNPLFE